VISLNTLRIGLILRIFPCLVIHILYINTHSAVLTENRITPVNMIIEKQQIEFLTVNQALKKSLFKKLIKLVLIFLILYLEFVEQF